MRPSPQLPAEPLARRETLADILRRASVRCPERLAVACGDVRWTCAKFDAVCGRVAAGLAAHGIAPGDRVAILARNLHAFAAMRFALARLGAVLVPINFMLKADEVAYIPRQAGATLLATDTGLTPLARATAALQTPVRTLLWLPAEDSGAGPAGPETSADAEGMLRFDDLAACPDALPAAPPRRASASRPHLMLGYLDDAERTAAAFAGGGFHSGDFATIDADGYVSVVDRKKDTIKTGGKNVARRGVEETIYKLPQVSEVAVVRVPHPRWIAAVVAIVVCKPGPQLDEAEVLAHCRDRLASFKVPKRAVFIEKLPKNPSGKLLKRQLREDFAGGFDPGS